MPTTKSLLLLDDLLAIGDPEIEPPTTGPDARRRRLTALLKTAALARAAPALYVVEDAHWIDGASESLIAEFLGAMRETHAFALVTYRPEYQGKLSEQADQSVALEPLADSEATTLIVELLGADPSVAVVGSKIAERAGGNPFFAEELVRDLAERGVLRGQPGEYVQRGDPTDTHVPATLQATIGARIDRLGTGAKRTLNAAAVIGVRFTDAQLTSLVDPVCTAELLDADLIDEVSSIPVAEYVFRHPLIRSVAYESQLRSARAELHQRLAAAMQRDGTPGSLDENAALIAMHVEAAGDLRSAFDWHMRAGTWLNLRNIVAARTSWQRARRVADRLPAEDPDRMRMRIQSRTLLCGSAWLAGLSSAETGFEELRQLCAESGDQRSVAIGMSGMVMALAFHNRAREASELGSELSELVERLDDDELASAVLTATMAAKWETGEVTELWRLAQRVIDLTGGDPTAGTLFLGSPFCLSIAMRGVARMCLGRPGWKADLDEAIAIARALDPLTQIVATLHKYAHIGLGALKADGQALRDTAESLLVAERSGDDFTLSHAHLARGITLVAHGGAERESGVEHLRRARQDGVEGRGNTSIVQIADIQLARLYYESGDLDTAIALSGAVLDRLFDCGAMLWRGPATTVLVEALLARNATSDVPAARAAIERLAAVPTDPGYVLHDLPLLRLRALIERVDGDEEAYRGFVAGYRALADACELEGHQALASSMT